MIAFFPEPYPDELLYSICARYHIMSRNNDFRHTVEDLFGCRQACAVYDFPSRLAALCGRLPRGSSHTPASLIRNHTLFPLYQPFLTDYSAGKIAKDMAASNRGGTIHCSIGVMTSSIKSPRFLRYCPVCKESDITEFGEPYWHRAHQIANLRICHKHGSPLINSDAVISAPVNKHAFIALDYNPVIRTGNPSHDNLERHMTVANAVSWILQNNLPTLGFGRIVHAYHRFLKLRGLITGEGHVRQDAFRQAFLNYYGEDFLQEVGCALVNGGHQGWLAAMVRKRRNSAHPLHHLLLIQWLCSTPEVFYRACLQIQPEIVVPNALNLSGIHAKHHQPVSMAMDREGSEISKGAALVQNSQLGKRRREWLAIVRRSSGVCRKHLRAANQAAFGWLYRNDHDWLYDHLPAPLPRSKAQDLRVDWNQRDQHFANEVRRSAQVILSEARPKQVTVTAIGTHIGCRTLIQRHLDKMPVTADELRQWVESTEQFQMRRLGIVACRLQSEAVELKSWRLVRVAGLRPGYSPAVAARIQDLVG